MYVYSLLGTAVSDTGTRDADYESFYAFPTSLKTMTSTWWRQEPKVRVSDLRKALSLGIGAMIQ